MGIKKRLAIFGVGAMTLWLNSCNVIKPNLNKRTTQFWDGLAEYESTTWEESRSGLHFMISEPKKGEADAENYILAIDTDYIIKDGQKTAGDGRFDKIILHAPPGHPLKEYANLELLTVRYLNHKSWFEDIF